MSQTWSKGSTTAWRKLRARVLERDGYRCQLRLECCTETANVVHHTLGKTVTGDDPAHLVAACAECNGRVGDPSRFDPDAGCGVRW